VSLAFFVLPRHALVLTRSVNDAHGSDHPSRHATSVKHRHRSDQRLRPTLPSHSQHIFKKLARNRLSTTNCKRKRKHTLRRDTTNLPRKHTVPKTWVIHPGNASETSAIAPKQDVTRAVIARRNATRPGLIATTVPAAGSIALATDPSRL
jgi:hypothetical protein